MNRNPLGILIITYNRPQLFENCLDRAISARGENIVPIIVIRQNSEVDYLSAIKKAEHECDAVITVNGANRTVEENINFNRICGLNYMFGVLKFENVIVLEDDAHISDLSIDFCLEAITKFGRDKKFMGVNFGSRIPFDIRLRKTYSLLRYGQHGPASLITKRAWQGMRLNQLTRLKGKVAWDGWVESYLKKGFFVTPNLSMYIDLGHSGTHTPCYENEPYFKDLENSFDDAVDAHKKFIHVQVEHSWRIDSRSYKRRNNLEYWLRDLYSRIRALTQSEEIKS